MIKLNSKDASILARIAQYVNLPKNKREEMLDDAGDDAKEVGRVLLGEESDSDDANELATVIQTWVNGNRSQKAPRKRAAHGHQVAAQPV